MFFKKQASNRSSYALEFKSDQNGDMRVIGNRDALIALSLQLDQAIEGEEAISRKFRHPHQLNQDIIVTFEYLS